MAFDEVLLRAAADEGRRTLRFYGWSRPTLSLGYFQRWEDRQQHPPSLACDCVRRSSGGGAILHDRELTYSLAVPASDRLAASPVGLYGRVHRSLVALLGRFGIEAELYEPTKSSTMGGEPFLCFQRRAALDVIAQGAKLAGSAQRRWRGAILQHGSILLERSLFAPELPGLNEFRADPSDWVSFAGQWLAILTESLEQDFVASEVSPGEQAEAWQLASNKYQAESWNRRR